jgi:hypothetical protein
MQNLRVIESVIKKIITFKKGGKNIFREWLRPVVQNIVKLQTFKAKTRWTCKDTPRVFVSGRNTCYLQKEEERDLSLD